MIASNEPEEDSATLRRLRDEGARVRPLSECEQMALLAQIEQRLERRGRARMRWVTPALAAALCLLACALVYSSVEGSRRDAAPIEAMTSTRKAHSPRIPRAILHAPRVATDPRRISLGARGEIVLDESAVARLPPQLEKGPVGPVSIELDRGTLTASVGPRAAHEPLAIVTPQLRVVVIGTRFSVTVAEELTIVAVAHGRVRVERHGVAVLLDADESIRSDDPRFVARESSGTKRVQRREVCTPASQGAACLGRLRRVVSGSGLAAENALVALALSERDQRGDRATALAHLREYERRFPNGMLTREVALAIVHTLRSGGQAEEACSYALRYTQRFPDDKATAARLRAGCEQERLEH